MKNVITLPADSPVRAVFNMDGDYMRPYIQPGEAVKLEYKLPQNGECGLFSAGGEALVRQYCEDSLGNIYLFVADRKQKALDRFFPKGTGLECLGRLILDKTPPLPLDFGG